MIPKLRSRVPLSGSRLTDFVNGMQTCAIFPSVDVRRSMAKSREGSWCNVPADTRGPQANHISDKELDPRILNIIARLPNCRTHVSDALFGYRYIRPYLDRIDGGSVLEVGSGPCILLSHIKMNYPALRLVGIEPIIGGFETSREIATQLTRAHGLELFEGSYEEFVTEERFDLMFLINVFEHLPDWRHFLGFIERRLKPDGVCVILCPNYGFPYESHFRVPIILGKTVTRALFKRKIVNHEVRTHAAGLWDSLNFVSLRQIRRELMIHRKLRMIRHSRILDEQIERLRSDPEFLERQRVLGVLAAALSRVGITRLFRVWPLEYLQPYLFLELYITPYRA